jgi:acid phosphatase type 7
MRRYGNPPVPQPTLRLNGVGLPVALALCLCVSFYSIQPPEAGDDALIQPYLQAVTQNGITIMIESRTSDPVYVEYGTTSMYGKRVGTSAVRTTSAPSSIHAVRLTGLTPSTPYHYRVLRADDTTTDAVFRTAPLASSAIRIAWMADFQSGTECHDSMVVQVRKHHPDLLLYGGDLAWSGSYTSLRREFFRPLEQALIHSTPFVNTPGNHEGWERNMKAMTDTPLSASGTTDYYSFDYGPLHVLVLNTEVDHDSGSAQWRFALSDLAEPRRGWTIVMAHKPGYAPGGYTDAAMRRMAERIFGPRKVDLFLAGHSHFYQHNLLDGVHQMTIGSAGGRLHDPEKGKHTLAFAREHCFAVMDIDPRRLRLHVFNMHGSPLDSLELRKAP